MFAFAESAGYCHTMSQRPSLRKQTSADFLHKLRRACEWLQIERGRALEYLRLLEEFDSVNPLSDEHILAYYESYEILELFQLWHERINEFPGLKNKMKISCKQGPIMRDDENTSSSSNKPRNDAFGFILAGRFLSAGFSVECVDGISSCPVRQAPNVDFSFTWEGAYFNVECKRVQSDGQLLKRAKKARNQLSQIGDSGIIAVDCSVLYRPRGTVVETISPRQAESQMSRWLESSIEPIIRPSLSPKIVGFILFSRLPAMTSTGIVDPRGRFYRRRDSISSILAVGNPANADPSALEHIASTLRRRSMGTS